LWGDEFDEFPYPALWVVSGDVGLAEHPDEVVAVDDGQPAELVLLPGPYRFFDGVAASTLQAPYSAATLVPSTVESTSFTDVDSSNQFYSEISWLAAGGISTGYFDGRPSLVEAFSRSSLSWDSTAAASANDSRGSSA
jgi:hypothetical protein